MTEQEIEIVAEVLAKIGGNWYPDRAQSEPKPVTKRQREVAQLIVDAVKRSKAAHESAKKTGFASEGVIDAPPSANAAEDEALQVGESVLYRPPGDKRTVACRIEKLENGHAYVVPELRDIGWVSTHSLLPLNPNRDSGSQPPLPFPTPASMSDAQSEAAEELSLALARRPRATEGYARAKYYFSSSGKWIAFRRSETDRYLFDPRGNWIGWLPQDGSDIADLEGNYLGTIFHENRIYRKASGIIPKMPEIGFVMDPGQAKHVGDPGFAAPYAAPYGYKDVDMSKLPTRVRTGLKSRPAAPVRPKSPFEVWMSKIGLGGLARAIEGMFRA